MYYLKNNEIEVVVLNEVEKEKVLSIEKNTQIQSIETEQDILKYASGKIGKYYAVKNGKINGIYLNWDTCKKQIERFPNAMYKSFKVFNDVLEYLDYKKQLKENEQIEQKKKINRDELTTAYAYVDGSYNQKTKTYGYGVVLVVDNEEYEFLGSGNDVDMATMRNVSGEILGAMRAIEEAQNLNLSSLTIFYDYQGIESWANEEWKRNKTYTIAYHDFVKKAREKMEINFQKVKAHSGEEMNERVDKLAKQAVGI